MNKETELNSLTRFSNRVENYVKCRPHYPNEIINFLQIECGLSSTAIIADIGSGTGISSELFLINGNKVYGVEPNKEMRQAGEKTFSDNPNFISVDAKAEATTLQSESVEFIVSGQAFHWFHKVACKNEFKRILKPDGYVILMWNLRDRKSSFMDQYENILIKYGKDYEKLYQDDVDETEIKNFFYPAVMNKIKFPHFQDLNYEALEGRLLSSSYIPLNDSPFYNDMIMALKNIFAKNNINKKVKMEYETVMYCGRLQ